MEESQAHRTSRSLVTGRGTPAALCTDGAQEGEQWAVLGTDSLEVAFHEGQSDTSHRERFPEVEFFKTVCKALKRTG